MQTHHKRHTLHTPCALSIAGSDSGGGAGVQADLKVFSAREVYGATVITALTAQNTQEVRAIHTVPSSFIEAQMRAVFDDIKVHAVKIGMLGNSETIETVAKVLSEYKPEHIIVDPVMVAKSGDKLLESSAITAMKETLLPLSTLITPNLPEAHVLLEDEESDIEIKPPFSQASMPLMAKQLLSIGAKAVLVKGGHLDSGEKSADLYMDSKGFSWFSAERVNTTNTHGTGCSLSSAITAELAKQVPLIDAVKRAKQYIHKAITHADSLNIGRGHGPIHHFYETWQSSEK